MSHKRKFNYAIYHKGCLDGFSGFFVAHNSGRLTSDVHIHPDVPSAKMVPPGIEGKDVVIIDVAYKKPVLEQIFKLAKTVVFIDHHVSIAKDVEDLQAKYSAESDRITIVYDDKRSGATLAWKYFNPRYIAPLFLKYVEDNDTGTWQYENTKPFIYAVHANYHLSTEGKSLNKWFRLLNKQNVLDLVAEGKIMQKYLQHLVNINLPRHSMHRFPSTRLYEDSKGSFPDLYQRPAQHKVAVFCGLNCPSVTNLALAALERIECDFVMMWVYNLDRKNYVLSMRSKEVDISVIAKSLGGGGHKLAAACSFPASKYKIDDLFEGHALPRTFSSVSPPSNDTDRSK